MSYNIDWQAAYTFFANIQASVQETLDKFANKSRKNWDLTATTMDQPPRLIIMVRLITDKSMRRSEVFDAHSSITGPSPAYLNEEELDEIATVIAEIAMANNLRAYLEDSESPILVYVLKPKPNYATCFPLKQ